ncbi:DUF2769 domain-containing protein [Methanosarcina acetivorans]|nr:DUF2769 domain-containing protein [Methanosarcina acetivorans]
MTLEKRMNAERAGDRKKGLEEREKGERKMNYREMSHEEIEGTRIQIQELCICKSCLTWDPCAEKIGFCFPAVGKNRCIKKDKGCICGQCQAAAKFRLNQDYYCIIGPQKEKWEL